MASRRWGRVVPFGVAALAGVGVCGAVAGCIHGGVFGLDIPTLPVALRFTLDPLSAFFLIPVLLAGGAAALCIAPGPALPLFVAAMAAAVLASDGFTLAAGLALAAGSGWLLTAGEPGSRGWFGPAAFGAACLLGVFALLGPDVDFAALRAVPPQGWRSAAVLVLTLLGTVPPMLPGRDVPSHAGALLAGVSSKVALYLAIRVLLDLSGPASPLWWSLPFLATGTASVVLGALRANAADDLRAVFAALSAAAMGVCLVALGIVFAARSADLASLAALALAAAMLEALAHGVAGTLLALVDGAVVQGAGTRQLDRLGGLVHSMPATSVCALAGLASLAAMPPTAGFASVWLLLQSLFAAPRIGGLPLQIGLALVTGAVALGAALAVTAVVRVVAMALLGRPRSPRAAAAQEAPVQVRGALIGLAAIAATIGLLPGLVIRLFDPALQMLSSASLAQQANWLGIAAQEDAPGYSVLAVAVLLAVCSGAIVAAQRWAVTGLRRVPAWDGGFAAPPPWLPFGDPATQPTGAGFVQPLMQTFGSVDALARRPQLIAGRLWALHHGRLPEPTVRNALTLLFTALVALLAAVAWLQP